MIQEKNKPILNAPKVERPATATNSHSHASPIGAATAAGIGAGAAVGLVAGPAGIITGAVLGGIVGAVAGEAIMHKVDENAE